MRGTWLWGLLLALSVGFAHGAEGDAGKATALAREGESLYKKGAYSEALKRFEAAMAAGLETSAILYQAANCYRIARSDQVKEVEQMGRFAIPTPSSSRATPWMEKVGSRRTSTSGSNPSSATVSTEAFQKPSRSAEMR